MAAGSSGPPGAADTEGRLRRCIRDLASLDALVSACVGRTVDDAFDMVLEALPTALECDLVLLGMPSSPRRPAAAWYGTRLSDARLLALEEAIAAAKAADALLAFGSTPLHWVEVEVPVGKEHGLLLVARRARFEDDTDRVLVRSAANLVGTALESATVLEAARRKDDFIATLSHEIRNPLAPLRTAVAVVRAGGPAECARACDVMDRQLGHLVRLVDDLLDASRITRGTLVLRREPVDVAEVMRVAIESSGPGIAEAGHELEATLPASPAWVDGDPVRLAQILTNLLNNAARFTPRGGRIVLRGEARGDDVVVSVRDTGPGFSPDVVGRLFEMFAKSDRSPGLGIGLSLSRRLAEMHGGTIAARSDGPGRGAEFVVSLPSIPGPAMVRPGPPEAETRQRAGPPLRVLVADDSADATDVLSLLLTTLGCEVAIARDGEEAVEAARAFRPDVAILDIGMPRLDGYEAARRIRSEARGRVLLVAMTGWGQEEDRRRARDAGFDEHLLKPAEVGRIQRLLEAGAEMRATSPRRDGADVEGGGTP